LFIDATGGRRMSAECHRCGQDLVYPEGSWPVGECPVCEMRVTDEMVERAARAANLDAGRQRGLAFEDDWEDITEQERGGWRQVARAALTAALSQEKP
jgi:uncharacterized Zn finger protein (UPF0148 family)